VPKVRGFPTTNGGLTTQLSQRFYARFEHAKRDEVPPGWGFFGGNPVFAQQIGRRCQYYCKSVSFTQQCLGAILSMNTPCIAVALKIVHDSDSVVR
jgi:hypothetical protein